jgi:dipeptidyl aminopeptidase/acylaminoacyl peptidase
MNDERSQALQLHRSSLIVHRSSTAKGHMRRLALLLLVAIPLFAEPQPHPMRFEDMAAMQRVGAPQLSPDGKWIAYDAATPRLAVNAISSALYLVPAGGGKSRQITEGRRQDAGPMWSPDGRSLAFVSTREGGAYQVYLYELAAGGSRKVGDLPGGAGALKWLPDGSGLVVVSDIYPDCGVDPTCIKDKTSAAEAAPTKARVITSLLYRHWKAWQEPTRSHILYLPLNGGNLRDLTPGAFDAPPFSVGGGDEFDVSPDGKELVFARDTEARPEVSTNSDLFVVPIAGGEPKRITSRTGADTSPKYSPDGRYIAWRSQARAGYESDIWELWLLDRASGQPHRVAAPFENNIESINWAPDSKSLYITAPLASKNAIYEINIATGAASLLWNAASADALAVSRDNKTLYFESSSLATPSEIFVLPKGGKAAQLTHENDELLSTIAMGATSDFWWTGAENAKVQGLVVRPPNFDASKKYPLLLLLHGGPQGQWSDAWSYRWNPQMFAAQGYVVLMPNPRGSTGYGQRFVEEISKDWGGKAYTDVMNGVDAFSAQPFIDATRMGAAGGSYGGYLVNWILGHSDRFKALVSHAGLYDLESEYGATEELWFAEWEMGGNPWEHRELYEKWSPNRYVKNFKTPTLVIHGELDFRVPVNQALELFTALQRRNVPSKMLLFPDEGHWVLKPQNSRLWYATVTDWFDQYLK